MTTNLKKFILLIVNFLIRLIFLQKLIYVGQHLLFETFNCNKSLKMLLLHKSNFRKCHSKKLIFLYL